MTDPYAPPVPALSLISTTKVPNIFPVDSTTYRLAVVGEAPGADEEAQGIPFIGASGKFLDAILGAVGVLRSGCFIGNVCKLRPPGNDITEWGFDHPNVLQGWEELKNDLLSFRPNCILALGNTPLHFLTGKTGISTWRGSILQTPWGKVVPSIHPASVLRDYKQWPLLRFDCQRARAEAESPSYSVPQRTLELNLSSHEICNRLDNWPTGQLFSFDIEGGLDAFPCCSVAGESNRGFIIAWSKHSSDDQGRIAVALSRALYSTSIPKVLQNSLYDRFVLAYGYRMLIRNVVEDSMDKQWAIYPEMKKSLGLITSIWTREPCYKSDLMIYSQAALDRKVKDGSYDPHKAQENKYKGCILDSCVTLEATLAMDGALTPREERHYRFNVAIKNPLLYMEFRGFRYDSLQAELEKAQIKVALQECYTRIELKLTPIQWTKKENSTNLRGAKGFISATRLSKLLYDHKGYPVQKKGRAKDAKRTADKEALLNLYRKFPHDIFLAEILLHKKMEGVLKTLDWYVDPKDGRMKCCYNQYSKGEDEEADEGGGSTETGRLRCSKSIIPCQEDEVGGNLQTVTKKLRKLYLADEGMWLFQCDLAGADGWTVAARCLAQGDPTMWEDYHGGLKPAKIIALMYHHGVAATQCSRDELKERCKAVDQDGWLYFACKRIQHGTNYGMQGKTMQKQVMLDSYNITGTAVFQAVSVYDALQRLYYVRYPGLYQWHAWSKRQVLEGKNLISASGHERKFFGRRSTYNPKTRTKEADHDTWKEFLADEPQENTTYATNLALHKLWNDVDNRTPNGLIIEPLHQVHDALIGQFPKEQTTWAVAKIRTYFQNELEIANVKVTIPFEGAYGPSWGELGEKHGGGTI